VVTELDVFFVFFGILAFLCWVDPLSFLREPQRGIELWWGSLTPFVTGGPCRWLATGAVRPTDAAAFGVF
jgi:hypothetical protein